MVQHPLIVVSTGHRGLIFVFAALAGCALPAASQPDADPQVLAEEHARLAQTLDMHEGDVRRCYAESVDASRAQPEIGSDPAGQLAVRLVLNPAGEVRRVEIEEDTVGEPVTGCVATLLRTLRFERTTTSELELLKNYAFDVQESSTP